MNQQAKKQWIAAFAFVLAGAVLSMIAPSFEVAIVTWILLLTIYLFAFEVVGVDVAATCIMVLLGLLSYFGTHVGLAEPLVPESDLFNGFSSNAVISIIAVMIIGAGLDKTGLMSKVAGYILKIGGATETRIIPIISGTVAFISSFMQNVGAAALFLPVVSRISTRTGLPMSRLLMPMGFCAILGGTVTLVGSSPLILLNDLILNSNQVLPPEQQMTTFGLFSVTPVGVALVISGILYFVVAGRFVLPRAPEEPMNQAIDTMDYLREVYGIGFDLKEVVVPANSPLIGKKLDDIEHDWKIRVVAISHGGKEILIGATGLARDEGITPETVMAVIAAPEDLTHFVRENGLTQRMELITFADTMSPSKAGIAELVIPPGSSLIGKSARDLWMRKTYGASLLAIHRNGKTLVREGEGVRDEPFQAGDTLIVHIDWDSLHRLTKDRNFVVVTTDFPHEELRPHKVGWALVFFFIALILVLFTDIRLSIALLTGAIGMVLAGVLKIEEAYDAVSWKTVFLLASLIPLGYAVETSGTAAWIADKTLALFGEEPVVWQVQLAIAVLATLFTLVMSNVGATVLLVPLAINIALGAGGDPAVFALTVAIATSNSFLIPTHQVNALIMGPGGYRVADFMRAGGIMTILFLIVMMAMMNLIF